MSRESLGIRWICDVNRGREGMRGDFICAYRHKYDTYYYILTTDSIDESNASYPAHPAVCTSRVHYIRDIICISMHGSSNANTPSSKSSTPSQRHLLARCRSTTQRVIFPPSCDHVSQNGEIRDLKSDAVVRTASEKEQRHNGTTARCLQTLTIIRKIEDRLAALVTEYPNTPNHRHADLTTKKS